ncbi:MAG: hemolysin family protein [Lautropia sp.]|nr:hemolysin family protein [Lautropia sp.]
MDFSLSPSQQLFIIFLLVLTSAFFSAAEISLAASRRLKLKILADDGDTRAAEILALQARPGQFVTAVQIGINAVAILAGAIGESAISPIFAEWIGTFYQGPWLAPLAGTLSFLLVTGLFILFSDLLPKRVAMLIPETLALRLVRPIHLCIAIFKPVVWFFNTLADRFIRLFGLPAQRSDEITFDDISAIVDAGAQAGVLPDTEHHLIGNVFELESRLVSSAMTTRESIAYLTLQETDQELREQIAQLNHSRFLVCEDEIDQIIGYVESKDLLARIINNEPLTLKGAPWIKPVLTIPDSLTLSELLTQFRASREDFAIVLNEYALVVGLITLNDVMSTVMGDLVNDNQSQIVKRDDDSWLIDGLTPVDNVTRALDIEELPEDSNYETLAGFMMFSLRRMPKLTDTVTYGGYRFEVVDIDKHRIDQLLVTRVKPVEGAQADESGTQPDVTA